MTLESAPEIPGYQLIRLLGSGAMASVYLAVQESLDRQVALKVMAPSLATDPVFRQRFLKEGKIIARLNHPHIITIHDIGVYQTRYYMAMEYVEGGDLKDRIQQGLTPMHAVDILCQMTKALGYAHRRGFVHRDVKPANVLFRDDGTAVLSDFGIAKGFNDQTQMTAVGWTVGTPNYMSPEQALGQPVDARSDLYSLGVVFYEMLTGSKPYQGTDAFSTALQHVQSPIPRLPKALAVYQPIIDRLLAKNPDERFAGADELSKAVARIPITEVDIDQSTRVVPVRSPPRPARLSRRAVRLAAGGLALVLAGAAGYLWLPDPPRASLSFGTGPAVTLPPAAPACPPVDAATREQIAGLKKTAQTHEEGGYLDYAADAYRRVLELDVCDSQAKARIQAIADKIEAMARQSLADKGDPGPALEIIASGLQIMPDHPGLLALRKQIAQ